MPPVHNNTSRTSHKHETVRSNRWNPNHKSRTPQKTNLLRKAVDKEKHSPQNSPIGDEGQTGTLDNSSPDSSSEDETHRKYLWQCPEVLSHLSKKDFQTSYKAGSETITKLQYFETIFLKNQSRRPTRCCTRSNGEGSQQGQRLRRETRNPRRIRDLLTESTQEKCDGESIKNFKPKQTREC